MALTAEQKQEVIDFIYNNITDEYYITNEELRNKILDKLGYKVAPQTVASIIDKFDGIVKNNNINNKVRYKKVFCYILKKINSQVFLINEKNNIQILIRDYNNNRVSINGNTLEKKIKDCCIIFNETSTHVSAYYKISYLIDFPEWCYSYPEVINDILSYSSISPDELPNILYPKDIEIAKNICFNGKWWTIINKIHKMRDCKNLNVNQYAEYFYILNKYYFNVSYSNTISIDDFIQIILPLARKIRINDVKSFNDVTYSYSDLFSFLVKAKRLGCISLIDTNRDFKTNKDNITEIFKAKENIILANQLTKLNFLNHYIIDDFEIIVPQNVENLIDEGKQQNNCVGHYYNNSIINGNNYIYFIRHKNNNSKSYVTCRFRVDTNETVEYRLKNNKPFNNNALIKRIDEIIKANLTK